MVHEPIHDSFRPGADRRIWRYGALVLIVAFAVLAWDASSLGIAAAYSDPVAKIRAQDEAIYTNSAMRMARDGDWLDPRVMGRLFYQKPPMLFWLSAGSIRALGLSLFAVRLPALLLGSLGIAAVFVWCASTRSVAAGLLGSGMLLMNPLWQTFSRLCYTDVLASSFSALALTAVALDARLERGRTRLIFGACVAAAILSKSVAGVLPVVVLLAFYFAMAPSKRPSFASIRETLLVLFATAAPWHVYELLVHREWFWADYVQLELLGIGLHPEQAGVFNQSALFYVDRLLRIDPVFVLIAATGIVGLALRLRSWREDAPRLLAILWTLFVVLALCAFQAKNLPYLTLALPPLAILGALGGFWDGRPRITMTVFGVLLIARLFAGGSSGTAPPIEGAAAIRAYENLHRDAELIVVEPDDEFYSSTLPIPHVRYCFLDPAGSIARAVPYYPPLGVTVSADQFVRLPELLPEFRKRLLAWGLDSTEPVAGTITLHAPGELDAIIRSRPNSDFYIPWEWAATLPNATMAHHRFRYSDSRSFLLSNVAGQLRRSVSLLPDNW